MIVCIILAVIGGAALVFTGGVCLAIVAAMYIRDRHSAGQFDEETWL